MLNSSIAWELAPTLRLCQICRKRCDQPSALRCTACRLSYHHGCCKSPPSREWFCPACVETSTQVPTCLVCSQQHDYLTPCRKCYHFFHAECVADVSYEYDFMCRGCDPKNKDSRKALKRKADAPPPIVFPTDMNNDLCRAMLDELECQPGVGPFLEPVDLDLVPGYRDVIANPIDMASIRNRIEAQCYETPEDFAADMELMFSNCRTFNEDDSPVGMAEKNGWSKCCPYLLLISEIRKPHFLGSEIGGRI
ncbi:Bromodomain protein [Teladorsagia circumcincta]|uniref:Bromodomain protein n=1 Tax=Teladorsagia circumcincta TaxID=45464 RepID=A0A2G9TRK9_TELCI|nr:Bromodomain protein [Teladorsagia circumcincta]